jgi:hypothetical protein
VSKADDINTLFRRFGGNADTYKEIVAAEHVGSARQKWPLLGQIQPQISNEPPDVVKHGPRAVDSAVRQVQPFPAPPSDARAHAMAGVQAPRSAGLAIREWREAAADVSSVADPAAVDAVVRAEIPVADSASEHRPSLAFLGAGESNAEAPRNISPGVLDVEETDLQQLFRRMLAAAQPVAPAASPAHPLKRLVKW